MLPEKRLPMRHTREILRLHFESHLAPRQIAKICKVAKSTVQRYLERLEAAGLSWPLPADLDDVALERRLFPPPPAASPEQRPLPDCHSTDSAPRRPDLLQRLGRAMLAGLECHHPLQAARQGLD